MGPFSICIHAWLTSVNCESRDWLRWYSSLTLERCGSGFTNIVFKLILRIDISCEIGYRGVPRNHINWKPTEFKVKAWCREATSHKQARFMSSYAKTSWYQNTCQYCLFHGTETIHMVIFQPLIEFHGNFILLYINSYSSYRNQLLHIPWQIDCVMCNVL